MREVVLDTETTGLSPQEGHRIVEIGAVELINQVPTGEFYHQYINPERDMPKQAYDVHGLSEGFLQAHPVFGEIAAAFYEFVSDDTLVIHNASFDILFLNAELARLNLEAICEEQVIDTLAMARKKHPMGPNSLDALCRRYGIDNSNRTTHGALIDAKLLAEVYMELTGGRQQDLAIPQGPQASGEAPSRENKTALPRPRPLTPRLSETEKAAHKELLSSLGKTPIWRNYNSA